MAQSGLFAQKKLQKSTIKGELIRNMPVCKVQIFFVPVQGRYSDWRRKESMKRKEKGKKMERKIKLLSL